MSVKWIATQLAAVGKTQADLARALEINPSAVSRLLKGERMLKTAEIPQVAALLEVTGETLLRGLREPDGGGARLDVQNKPARYSEPTSTNSELIPIRSAGRGSDHQEMFLEDGPVGHTRRPGSLQGVRQAYAIYMPGDSMSPRYEPGWLLFVNPFKPARQGRDVVVEKKDGAVLIKTLGRRTGGKVALHSVNKDYADIEIPESEISHIHVITGSDQEGG